MFRRPALAALATLAATAAHADEATPDTYTWMHETRDVMGEGLLWNDRLGDGRDRLKTGGLTQSVLLPESLFSDDPWFGGRAAAVELQGRVLAITPDFLAGGVRPHAQYAGAGIYLRTFGEARPVAGAQLSVEDRVGIELGYRGDALPIFEIQDALHEGMGMAVPGRAPGSALDPAAHINAEARRTWRFATGFAGHDVDIAPFAALSAGTRENALRAGADVILGSSLAARTWNHDPATGALIPGGSAPREGAHWTVWAGGEVGLVASDALIEGEVGGLPGMADPAPVTARLRAGVQLEWSGIALTYSLAWLSPEVEHQDGGQLIGGVQLKVRF